MGQVSTRFLAEADFSAWESFLVTSPQASVYHLPGYLDALCTAAGGSFRILGAFRGGQLVGGLGLYERRWLGQRLVGPRLLLYYNGLALGEERSSYPSVRTARSLEVQWALLEGLGSVGYRRIHLRNHHSVTDVRPFLVAGWRTDPDYTYVVDLDERLEDRVEQNLRRLVKRCSDGSIELTEDEDVHSFFELHRQALERHGVGPYLGREAFAGMLRRLRAAGLARLFHARRADGRSVATQLVLLGPRRTSHTVAAATDAGELRSGITAWLRLRVFERLREAGVATNDLTDAALNPVTHFKSQLGGNLRSCLVLRAPESALFRAQSQMDLGRRSLRRAYRRLRGWK